MVEVFDKFTYILKICELCLARVSVFHLIRVEVKMLQWYNWIA